MPPNVSSSGCLLGWTARTGPRRLPRESSPTPSGANLAYRLSWWTSASRPPRRNARLSRAASSANSAARASTEWRLRCCFRVISTTGGDRSLAEDEEHPQHITLIDESGREPQFHLHDAFDHEGAG